MDIKEVYKSNAEFVYRFLFGLCRDSAVAEELTQETFYQAVKSSASFDGTCKVSTWLCQIAKHLWYQSLEKEKSAKRNSTLFHPEHTTKLEEEVEQKQAKMRLFQAVHVLEAVAKEVFLLRVTGAFSFREIGELFGKSENWARVTYYRAKQKVVKEENLL